jgi:L-iditol 2-dehydrogenase
MKMQAALWYGPEEVRVEETDIPEVGPGEVLAKIGAALTCGTDFKLFRRGHALLVKNLPSPFGHEMAGTIVAMGSGVKNFKIGDRVVAANSSPCDHCFYCLKGQRNLCENLEFLNGAYAEYIRIPSRIVEKNLYKIPDRLSFKEAALTEPLACIVHCLDLQRISAGDSVCIIGSGPAGLLFVQMAKMLGARVICVARNPEKLEVAKRLGADDVLSTLHTSDLKKEVHRLVNRSANHSHGPDLVIEAAGQPETWEMALSLVRKGGRVCFYGGCKQETSVRFDTHRIHYEQISMNGVFHHTPHHFAKALRLISEGKIKIGHLIEGEKRLSEITQIFRKGVNDNPLKFAILP